MNKFVYLAGPIEGCDEGEIQEWRKYAQSGVVENIIGINPYRAETESESPESKKRVVMKNYMDIKFCNLILACLPKHINDRRPSYGTTSEIAWGYSLQKPIVIVSDDESLTPIATFLTHDDCANRLDPDIDSNFMEVVTDVLTKDDRVKESLDAFDRELVMPVFKDGIEPFLSKNR